ncbi:MAG: hypothetical protein IT373_03920 [Polyangiaceae bacterium]|nr:hypothetical protein [Polyangiaceae bacterium]
MRTSSTALAIFAAALLGSLGTACTSLAQPDEIVVTKEPLGAPRPADVPAPGAAAGNADARPAQNAARAAQPSCGN